MLLWQLDSLSEYVYSTERLRQTIIRPCTINIVRIAFIRNFHWRRMREGWVITIIIDFISALIKSMLLFITVKVIATSTG